MKKLLAILAAIVLLLPTVCVAERHYLERIEETVASSYQYYCPYHPNANLIYHHGSYVIQGDAWVHYYYPYAYYTCTICGETLQEYGDEQEQTHTFVNGECIVCHYRELPVSVPSRRDPSGWDTQFRDGMSKNSGTLYMNLSYLHDGNINTRFFYTIWKSERVDAIPEFTVYFNNASISRMGIINGHISTSNMYYQHARAQNVTVKIYSSEGYYETHFKIPDNYTQDYQIFSLGRTYNGVSRIELFFEDYYPGQGSAQYEMNITDIVFE